MSKIKLSVNHKEVLRTDGKPELIKGGDIFSLGNGFYYVKGKKPNKTDDVDIDIINSKKGVEVFSDENMLGKKSPSDLVLEGANPDQVFAAQEQYKQIHGINDDGTKKKAKNGGIWSSIKRFFGINDNIQTPVKGNDKKQYDNMSKKTKDIFIDSLIESMNNLNKTKLNNTNVNNMSPIDLQILNRELNKDILLNNSHSTGVQSKKCGGRVKAVGGTIVIYKDGTKHNTNDKDYDPSQIDENATDIYHGQKSLKTSHWLSTGLGALSKTAAGIIGAGINNATNRKYIGQMEELVKKIKTYNRPLTKLKTHVTIDPQLSEIDNALRIGIKDIDANTASSQVALARKRGLRLNSFLQKSKLYGYKENAENELINKERMLQTSEMREDIKDAQNIENQKLQMLAGLIDKRAENATATNQNIVGSIVGGVDTLLNGVNQYEQLLAGLAADPNGAKAYHGFEGMSTNWRKKAYKKKDNED